MQVTPTPGVSLQVLRGRPVSCFCTWGLSWRVTAGQDVAIWLCRIPGTLGIHVPKGDFSKSWSPTEGQDLLPGKTDALGCPLLLEV